MLLNSVSRKLADAAAAAAGDGGKRRVPESGAGSPRVANYEFRHEDALDPPLQRLAIQFLPSVSIAADAPQHVRPTSADARFSHRPPSSSGAGSVQLLQASGANSVRYTECTSDNSASPNMQVPNVKFNQLLF